MKRTIALFLCVTILALLATSCYVKKPCPAYGRYSENLPAVEIPVI